MEEEFNNECLHTEGTNSEQCYDETTDFFLGISIKCIICNKELDFITE